MPEPRPSYPRDYYSKPIPLQDVAFILMPFDGFDGVHKAIRKAVKRARSLRPDLVALEPVRADDLHRKVVLEKILGQIGEAKVVIADLTGRNANVFYETGIAQTMKENVLLLAQDIEDIPADLRPFEYVIYEDSEVGLDKLVIDLADAIHQLPEEGPAVVLQDWGSPQDMKRQLRSLLQGCEQRWTQEVVPEQDKIFREDFEGRLAASNTRTEQRAAVVAAIQALHPAFAAPWQNIEDLGREVIDRRASEVLPDLLKALERAYGLSRRVQGHPSVVGHGQLLVLHTWMLWGAYGLEQENWEAVEALLHRPLTLDRHSHTKLQRAPLADFKFVFVPDASGPAQGRGDDEVAIQSVLGQCEALTPTWFRDLEEARGFFGLWLLASDLAQAAIRQYESIDWPAWPYAPEAEFIRLFPLLESDANYSKGFVGAVAKTSPAKLNELWQNGLRQQLMDTSSLWPELRRRTVFRELPERFAE